VKGRWQQEVEGGCCVASRDHIWGLKEPHFEGSLRHLSGSLKNSLRTWFFKEPWSERFFVEPYMMPSRTIF